MDAANVGTAEVEAAIICFYREPARAAEANAYLVAFQQSDSAWEIAEQLLTSTHADVSHFAACSLHQQAKRSASARSTDVLQSQCSRLLGTVGSMPSNLVRSQLCLAVSVLAASLFAADTGGPAALCASAVFMALPPSTKIELLAALPQACPLHHEQLRVLLSHVLSLLQAQARADAPLELGMAQCLRAWQPLGLDLPDLSNGQPLLAALLLGLREAEPLCGVAAEVLCDAMQVGSFPDAQNAPILAGLLRDVLLGAPCCLGEGAAEGSTLAVARVLGAAVCAAPEVVESMDAAGGGEGERLRGLLLSLSSQPDRRCLEELAPAWAALSPLTAAPGHAASWQQLAEVLLRQSTLPEDGDAGGLVLDWAEVDALEQGDFVRFRRHTVHECWQCAANALGAREVLRLVCASLALSGHGMTAGGGGWRPLEATLLALTCIAPAVLPPPVRGQGLPPGGAARAAVDGNRAAAVAAAAAAAAEAAAESPEQREIEPSVRGVLGGVVSLPLLSHAELSITALRTLAAYAPWLAPASRAELACSCANYCLSSLQHPVAAVAVAAASAFVALCSQPGVAASLAAPAIIPGLLQAVLGALQSAALQREEVSEAPPQLLAGLMRLLVLLPPSDLAHALHAVSSPLIAQLQPLAAQLRAAAQGGAAHREAPLLLRVLAVTCLLRTCIRYLDAAPRLQDGSHAALLVMQVSWPALEECRAAAELSAEHAALAISLCETYEAAMKSGALAPLMPQVVTALLSLLSSSGPRPPGCTSLTALASAVEWFCKTAEARPQMGEVLERVRLAVSPHLCAPERLAEASELGARYLDLLYRAALFCSPALFGSPQVLHEALQLLVPCLRQPQRELLRSACSLLARLASAAESTQLAPHLDSLAEPLLGALLSAVATHAPEGLPARVDDALRTLLQCCGGRAREWLARAVLAEECGPLVGAEAKQQLVQAALELLDDNRSFRALVCDFQMLCRATAPPPREAMQTTYFII